MAESVGICLGSKDTIMRCTDETEMVWYEGTAIISSEKAIHTHRHTHFKSIEYSDGFMKIKKKFLFSFYTAIALN